MSLAVQIVARSGEGLKSGPIALAVILVLCVVCYFLFKSMSRHLKKVRDEFPSDAAPAVMPPTTTPPAVMPTSVPEDEPTNGTAPAE